MYRQVSTDSSARPGIFFQFFLDLWILSGQNNIIKVKLALPSSISAQCFCSNQNIMLHPNHLKLSSLISCRLVLHSTILQAHSSTVYTFLPFCHCKPTANKQQQTYISHLTSTPTSPSLAYYLFFVFDTFINRVQHPSSFTLLPCDLLLSSFPNMLCLSLHSKYMYNTLALQYFSCFQCQMSMSNVMWCYRSHLCVSAAVHGTIGA